MSRILVIKLSSLGDFVQSLGAFRAIREHHRDSELILLTTPPYVAMARDCGMFDEVWTDERPSWWRPDRWLALRQRLRGAHFARVYDLQRSQRTAWYFRLLDRKEVEWVGSAPGCSHRYVEPSQPTHAMERHAQMLALGGIGRVPAPDLSFIKADVGRFALPQGYVLLVPGSAARRRIKRWPAENYAQVANALASRGMIPVLICGSAEREEAQRIAAACPQARDIETGINEIVELARGAAVAVGNDTGPLHLIGAAGCPVVALFCRESHPVKTRPPGPSITVLQRPDLVDLPVAEVLETIDKVVRRPGR
jgi:ADP-heptose:LPS heptosyltransferase